MSQSHFMLFELQNGLSYQSQTDDCPYSQHAKAVWYSFPDQQYGGTEYSQDETLYFPLAIGSGGAYLGLPKLGAGDRAWCWWNRQSGRWECVAPSQQTAYRGVLIEEMTQGGTAQASLMIIEHGETEGTDSPWAEVTAHDWFLDNEQTLPAGTRIRLEWFADDRRWYVTNAACGLPQ